MTKNVRAVFFQFKFPYHTTSTSKFPYVSSIVSQNKEN